MKNNSKEVGKKLYKVYYNGDTKSFEIKEFDTNFVNDCGVYYIDNNDIEYESFYHIAEYTACTTELSILAEKRVKTGLLDYLLVTPSCGTTFIMSFIHKDNAEEFIETHQDLLNVKDLSNYYDMIDSKSRYSGLQQLTDLNEVIRTIMKSEEIYKTDSIKDFLYTYISDVVDICEALDSKKVEVRS